MPTTLRPGAGPGGPSRAERRPREPGVQMQGLDPKEASAVAVPRQPRPEVLGTSARGARS